MLGDRFFEEVNEWDEIGQEPDYIMPEVLPPGSPESAAGPEEVSGGGVD